MSSQMKPQKANEKNLLTGPYLFLAYDHGLGRGPVDFKNHPQGADPSYVIDLAHDGRFSALALEPGLARLYQNEIKQARVPLLVKVNGRTNFSNNSFFAPQLCSVQYAVERLGANALGAVVFLGDPDEGRMLEMLGHIVEEANQYENTHKPVVGWMYVVEDYKSSETADPERTAHAARIGAELGCDIVKVPWTGDVESFSWVCRAAGSATKVVVAGGTKTDTPQDFLQIMRDAKEAGAAGVAVGRNIWQVEREEALKTAQALREIFEG